MPAARAKKPRQQNEHERAMHQMLVAAGIPAADVQPEYEFALPDHRWRADFALPASQVLVEVNGGIWLGTRGGHTSGTGHRRDNIKRNWAQLRGWLVLTADTDAEIMWGVACQAARAHRARKGQPRESVS